MPFENHIAKGELSAAISALDQALYLHEQWSNGLYACLICRFPPDERDMAEDSHRSCMFGQWYYAQDGSHFARHAGFQAVAIEHEQMHRLAARLLQRVQADEEIQIREYDAFVNALSTLRSEIAALQLELRDAMTNRDPLTGAASRIGMLTRLRTQHELVRRGVQTCTIAMMDLDLFKAVNDNFGHLAGDAALIATVRMVIDQLRPYDEFYRYGGEEFLLCAPGTDLAAGHAAVERLRESIAGIEIEVGKGAAMHVTASFGVTLLDADVTVEESIARADRALYAAKSNGRNRTCIWDASMA